MTRDDVLQLSAGLPGAVEDYPFGDPTSAVDGLPRAARLVLGS